MGIYSHKYKSVNDIPKGSTITIPNDVTNAGRALKLMESAKLIKLKDDFDPKGSIEQITENPKNLVIKPVAAGQTTRTLDDVGAAIINNGFAVQAGLNPGKTLFIKKIRLRKLQCHTLMLSQPRLNIKMIKNLRKS